jgi:hypothetical protein
MSNSADQPIEAYVRAALELQGYQLAQETIAEVVLQFSRIETIAQSMLHLQQPFSSDAAAVFRP